MWQLMNDRVRLAKFLFGLDAVLGILSIAGAALYGAADGLPEELGALGNAVVPQIPELIGNAILASIQDQQAAA